MKKVLLLLFVFSMTFLVARERQILRNDHNDEYIKDKIRFALSIKPKRHDFLITPNSKPYMKRHMNVTGG